ncbi:beta-ketoacyl synthase N-terminal-like domain-containing protein [Mycobacterium marinum]|uniref:beta-ketoacyl synthase N-terminal-like domain-containing protein n=1 Tax=Mycobacterium marinum TaxID=1781 RepID=UPI0039C9BE7B
MDPEHNNLFEALKRVAVELNQTRAQLREHEERADVRVAIVGVGCRYPGGVESAGGLWDVVVGGRDVISGFPVDRGGGDCGCGVSVSGWGGVGGGFVGCGGGGSGCDFGVSG